MSVILTEGDFGYNIVWPLGERSQRLSRNFISYEVHSGMHVGRSTLCKQMHSEARWSDSLDVTLPSRVLVALTRFGLAQPITLSDTLGRGTTLGPSMPPVRYRLRYRLHGVLYLPIGNAAPA